MQYCAPEISRSRSRSRTMLRAIRRCLQGPLLIPISVLGIVFALIAVVKNAHELRSARISLTHMTLAFGLFTAAWIAVLGRLRRIALADAQKFASLVDAAPEAIIGVTDSGEIDFANARVTEIFGYDETELVGKGIELLIPDRLRPSHVELRARYSRKPQPRTMGASRNVVGLRKDGAEFALEVSLNRVNTVPRPIVLCLIRDASEQRAIRQALLARNDALTANVAAMERRARELRALTELGELLQSCITELEVYPIISQALRTLFPSTSGGLYLLNSSRNLVELTTAWGETQQGGTPVFTPTECWALRRGRAHEPPVDATSGVQCPHYHTLTGYVTHCIPLAAQGDTMGVLCLKEPLGHAEGVSEEVLRALTEQCALAIANLRLREALRTQSIRDPLTGLFNRRFLEDWIDREFRRSERQVRPLSILMIDFDHFKRFNDTFGHQSGDLALREVCGVIQRSVRTSDFVCRVGGEELAVILPDTSMADALQVAESLRTEVQQKIITRGSQTLDSITVSIGVACAPRDAKTSEDLMRAADMALYEAKHAGRNRVVAAQPSRIPIITEPRADSLRRVGNV